MSEYQEIGQEYNSPRPGKTIVKMMSNACERFTQLYLDAASYYEHCGPIGALGFFQNLSPPTPNAESLEDKVN